IARLAPEGDAFTALGLDASRPTAMSPELRDYRFVHFATHGLMHSQHPELSGVVLSLVDEQGRPREGLLTLRDIYTLRLRAELVVLSACQTALGAEIAGEGLMGLPRGFFYAGAPRVIASLWKVDDRATAELMSFFYRELLQAKRRPAEALRQAQLAMWRDSERWQDPYYWAAFVLYGEWR
ncbi:MAG: CHAT domain-containing protein, partial [Acidobacteriota bacterium]